MVFDADPVAIVDDLERLPNGLPASYDPIDPHAPAAFAYTSGTTGEPKAVVHSQHNLLWPGLATIETSPPADGECIGTPLALTILNLMVLGPLTAWLRGSCVAVLHRTDGQGLAGEIEAARISRLLAVPTVLHDLVNSEVEPRQLATLAHVLVGGAGMPDGLAAAFGERFGVVPVGSYGLSEAPTGVARATGALAPVELVVIDAAGDELPPGAEGELCVRARSDGPWANSWTPTLGYWKQPEATRSVLRDGLLHTGDVGTVGADGSLRVLGRSSGMIVRGGANVHPAEIEKVLAAHPAVASASVVGVADERLGQVVAAAIALEDRARGQVSDVQLTAWAADRLSRYKVPERWALLDELPVNEMGKPSLAAIAALFD